MLQQNQELIFLYVFPFLISLLHFSAWPNFLYLVPLDDKVPEGVEPRFWEEEGFYVGKPPQVSSANLNIMENRIMDTNQV